jgi:hypothetical protein
MRHLTDASTFDIAEKPANVGQRFVERSYRSTHSEGATHETHGHKNKLERHWNDGGAPARVSPRDAPVLRAIHKLDHPVDDLGEALRQTSEVDTGKERRPRLLTSRAQRLELWPQWPQIVSAVLRHVLQRSTQRLGVDGMTWASR